MAADVELSHPRVWRRFWDLMMTRRFAIPAFWDYPVWDDFMYQIMCQDMGRLGAYRAAIGRAVKGKTVVEIGTGNQAPLAIMCAEAGASRVYAIEVNESSAAAAVSLVRHRGLSDRIEVISGSSMTVELPEKADVCVSEIIGCVGSSEGAVAILRNAKRFLKDSGTMVPERCVTRIAPVSLPEGLYHDDLVQQVVEYYTQRVYQTMGRRVPFTRFEYYNFPEPNLISEPGIFEDICFNSDLQESYATATRFAVASACRLDGFLLWLNLYVDSSAMIDTFNGSVWGAIFVAGETLALYEGDTLDITSTVRPSANGINPDYTIHCAVRQEGDRVRSFVINSNY